MSDELRQRLVDAKLAGKRDNANGEYFFRSNERAADVALAVLEQWLADQSGLSFQTTDITAKEAVVSAAVIWYDKLVGVGHYSADDRAVDHSAFRSDKWPYEVDLAAAVERLKGIGEDDGDIDPILVKLKARRIALGWSQVKLAKSSKTSQSAISEMETGRVSPTLDTLKRVARCLGLEAELTSPESN